MAHVRLPVSPGRAALALALCAFAGTAQAQDNVPAADWIPLFDGKTLDGWVPKIRGFRVGENFANTFRVVDGLLTVSYDGYDDFDGRFGHLFYRHPYSHYRVRLEYRFIGEQAPGATGWAFRWAFRNSGLMLHSQSPESMGLEQDFPISIEFQFLGGRDDGEPRPTGSMCSPGTEVVMNGERAPSHCIESNGPTIDGDAWVKVEALVLGSERVVHYVNGQPVIEYGGITMGGGMVSGHESALKKDGEPLAAGYLSLQSESHPVQFRNIELLDLQGCKDPQATNYRPYFVVDDRSRCRYAE